jgi:hypothetical protein
VKWGFLQLYGEHQEFVATGDMHSINDASGGAYYFEACDIHDSPSDLAVTHTYETNRYARVSAQHQPDTTGTQVERHRRTDGTSSTVYRVYDAGWSVVPSAADKTRCDDPNVPFGILRTYPLPPPK